MVRIPPPVLALGAALAQRALTRDARPPKTVRAVVAGAIAVASLALAGASARRFHRSGTTVDPFEPERASVLVTTGANSITRNPMYTGLAGLLVANAVRRGSWKALVPIVGFVLVIDRWQIPYEESALLSSFGPEYETYRDRVPRWLGPRSVTPVLSRGRR